MSEDYKRLPDVKRHVGIVFDNSIRRLYAERLKRMGYSVSEFERTEEIWPQLEYIHVVVADSHNGGKDLGFKLSDKVNKFYAGNKPVILMNNTDEFSPQKGKSAAAILKWDLNLESFQNRLEEVIGAFYSKNLFLVGEPKWALDTRISVAETMPVIYNSLEEAINNKERAYGVIVGAKVAEKKKVGSKKVSGLEVMKRFKDAGFEGCVYPQNIPSTLPKEDLMRVINLMLRRYDTKALRKKKDL